MKLSLVLLLSILISPSLEAQSKTGWRSATTEELKAVLPLRAPVEKERIETEMRTASGIVNSHGKAIAGVVLITAGYSADGKLLGLVGAVELVTRQVEQHHRRRLGRGQHPR